MNHVTIVILVEWQKICKSYFFAHNLSFRVGVRSVWWTFTSMLEMCFVLLRF